ncbi:MAG: UDP-N-acetylmuramoyl-L-alanine--D-glutamate ligase [Candidatus Aminicenantia bacterium]
MEIKGKKILVVGLGRTGEAVAQFLVSREAKVKISELKTKEELGDKVYFWQQKGVEIEYGGHREESFLESDLIVVSPGVSLLPEIKKAINKGIEVISEIELAFRFLKGKIVGITGSNGKSTTTTLVHKILNEAGLKSHLAGNIGFSLISFVDSSSEEDIYATEISSFQLKYIDQFKVNVSVILNITPDHLDWHPSFEDYYQTKKRLILTQNAEDYAILNADDPLTWSFRKEVTSQIFPFSRTKRLNRGSYIKDNKIIITNHKEQELIKVTQIPLVGVHNQENIMASALVAHLFNVPVSKIRESILNFKGLEHRMEKVTTINGVEFYNDSKATNVDATLKSLQSFDQDIILILGGRDKHGDFTKLREIVRQRVKRIILIGEAKEKIRRALERAVPLQAASSLKEAVILGFSSAQRGDIVLLAPACASFDMFENFEHRGRVFKEEVFKLKSEKTLGNREVKSV